MKQLRTLIIAIFTITVSLNLFGGTGSWVRRIPMSDLVLGNNYEVRDRYRDGMDVMPVENYRGYLFLDYTRKQFSDLSTSTWYLRLKYSYTHNGTTNEGFLQVSNRGLDNNGDLSDYVEIPCNTIFQGYQVSFSGIEKSTDGANWQAVSDYSNSGLPQDVDVRLELKSERLFELSSIDKSAIYPNNSAYEIHWNYIEGAEEYDLEWVHIDDMSAEFDELASIFSNTSTLESGGYTRPFELKEATRVRVWGTKYAIDKAYTTGRIYFRVRAVSRFVQGGVALEDIRLGEWNYFRVGSESLSPISSGKVATINIVTGTDFEPKKSWMYGVNFAEGGKNVSTITYFDGSNRGRQNMVYNTSDQITLVSESKYDYEGRQTISVIPAPIKGRDLRYRTKFNLSGTNTEFNEANFDYGVSEPLFSPATGESGAAQYFSANNQFTEDLYRSAIPDAQGYVYSQTIFRNDGTGRVERIGGVGPEFKADGDRAVRTFYGSPMPIELRRLFGSNVPADLDGYRKEMVMDANKQLSVTYYDKRGNVVATALAGKAPDNLIKLDAIGDPQIVETDLNNNNTQVDPYTIVSEHTFLNAVENNTIALHYDLAGHVELFSPDPIVIGNQTIQINGFCSSCVYHLDIEIYNQQGVRINHREEIFGPTSCTETSSVPYPPINYSVAIPEIGEYRIIKTLRVDLNAMQLAFEDQLLNSLAPNKETFINEYLETLDLSSCFNDCESYAAYKASLELDVANDMTTLERFQYIMNLKESNPTVYNQLISSYLDLYCNEAEVLDQAYNDQSIGGTQQNQNLCDALRAKMLNQISPNGVFWNLVPSSFTYQGNTYNKSQFLPNSSNPATWETGMAELFISSHREYCHLQTCAAYDQSNEYSIKLAQVLNTLNFSSSSSLFNEPFLVDVLGYTQDPFITSVFNIQPTLQAVVANYQNWAYDLNGNPVSSPKTDCSGQLIPPGTSLAEYVEIQANCFFNQANNPYTTPEAQQQLKISLFMGAYNQIKQQLIDRYKSTQNCNYFSDGNEVFVGAQTQELAQNTVNSGLSQIVGSINCVERSLNNTYYLLSTLPQACLVENGVTLTFDQNTQSYSANFTQSQLTTAYNNQNPSSLPELLYAFQRATCPQNNNGWFYNPGQGHPAKNSYDQIVNLLSGCTQGNIPFEVDPPSIVTIQTPESITTLSEYLVETSFEALAQELNDAYYQQVLQYPNRFSTTTSPNSVQVSISLQNGLIGEGYLYNVHDVIDNCMVYYPAYNFQLTITDTNCNQSISIYRSGQDKLHYFPNADPGTVNYNLEIIGFSNFDVVNGMINYDLNFLSFRDDYSSLNCSNNSTCTSKCTTFPSVRISDPYTPLTCIFPASSFEYAVFEDFNVPLPNFQEDCINSETQQAIAEASILYEQMLDELRIAFAQQVLHCVDKAKENFTMNYQLHEYQYTLYYYDLANNLVQTVPPQGVDVLTSDELSGENRLAGIYVFPEHLMETRYVYNGLNTLIAQFTPDGGLTEFYLDKLYRVRFSQNARQQFENKASYSKYDELGRVVEAGEFALRSNSMTNIANTEIENNLFPLRSTNPASNMVLDYTRTFYESPHSDASIASQFVDGQQNLRNAIGAIEHRYADYIISESQVAIRPNSAHLSVASYSYDPHKNVKQIVNTYYALRNLGQQHHSVEYDYDLISGNVNQVIYQRNKADEFRHLYHYDANNRLIRAFTSDNQGVIWEMDAKYFYYLHGALARTEIGEDKVSGTDYAYNLQGWLKGVNSATLIPQRDLGKDAAPGVNENFGEDVMGFQLGYHQTDYSPIGNSTAFSTTIALQQLNVAEQDQLNKANLFNGNISHMITAIKDLQESPLTILGNNYRYDQLQRIKAMDVYADGDLIQNNAFELSTTDLYLKQGEQGAYRERYSFDKNGNILHLERNGADQSQLAMDRLDYNYYEKDIDNTPSYTQSPKYSNRLASVNDLATANYSLDIENQSISNYKYDLSGQLIADVQEQISNIEWTVTGKVKFIDFDNGSGKEDVRFVYDPMDMRIAKIVYHNGSENNYTMTFYSYDAQGNVMATYTLEKNPYTSAGNEFTSEVFNLNEHHIYGAQRIGTQEKQENISRVNYQTNSTSLPTPILYSWDQTKRYAGDKRYELANHLGNVLEVVSDKKRSAIGGLRYSADVIAFSDYSPYGTLLQGRHASFNVNYRYGFQGQESDDEVKGEGNSVNYKYRMHDPRIGRFFAVDPLAPKYPELTPYQFSSNCPIWMVEIEGLEGTPVTVYHNTDAKAAMEIIKNGMKEGQTSGWSYFMTNSNGRGTGAEVASAEVQLEGTINVEGGKSITPSQWSGWFTDAKKNLGYGSIENGALSKAQRAAVDGERNAIAAKYMSEQGGELFTINIGSGQKIIAAKGAALKNFKITNITRGWTKLFSSSSFRQMMLESSLRNMASAKAVQSFMFMAAIMSVYDMQMHGNLSFGIIPNVDWDAPWHKQIEAGLRTNNFDKAYTGLKMLRKNDEYTIMWMTNQNMLEFLKSGKATGTNAGNYPTSSQFGQYPFMMIKYKGVGIGILSVPKNSQVLN